MVKHRNTHNNQWAGYIELHTINHHDRLESSVLKKDSQVLVIYIYKGITFASVQLAI